MSQPAAVRTAPSEAEIGAILQRMAEGYRNQARAPLLRNPGDVGLAFEDVTFPALDGVPLEAWFIPKAGSDKLIVVNHPRGFNRYGAPLHLEPWKATMAPLGSDVEVDFTRDYRIFNDAGYNVLTYDLRNHGHSGAGNGLVTSGLFEARDVVGSLRYLKSRPDLSGMIVGLFSRCLGCNSTIVAMSRYPDEFAGVRCLVGSQPLSPRFFSERQLERLGVPLERMADLEQAVKLITSMDFDQRSPVRAARDVKVPTLLYQVRDDAMTRPVDVQSIFDNIGANEKDLFWIEGTTRRIDGYTHFSRDPARILGWFDRYMQ
jgi:pimeloyl-ACP methyl ester carboxylesterase